MPEQPDFRVVDAIKDITYTMRQFTRDDRDIIIYHIFLAFCRRCGADIIDGGKCYCDPAYDE